MKEPLEKGMKYLLTYGKLIQSSGKKHDGDILIAPLDYQTFCFVEELLDDMGVTDAKLPYRFLYDDAYYLQENNVLHEKDFNRYVKGMIINKKEIEKTKN